MPGSTPATSQLDWLSSTTAIIVLSWSKATRDLLKSFSGGIRGTPSVICQRRWCHLLRRLPHTISPLEGSGFEPSVPRHEKWSMPSSSDQTRVGRTLTLGGGAESSLEGRDIELSVSPKDIRTSPYDLGANRSDRRQSREGDRWFESTSLLRRVCRYLRTAPTQDRGLTCIGRLQRRSR